jgi:hypothetical protein
MGVKRVARGTDQTQDNTIVSKHKTTSFAFGPVDYLANTLNSDWRKRDKYLHNCRTELRIESELFTPGNKSQLA